MITEAERNPIVIPATLSVLDDLAVRMVAHLPNIVVFSNGNENIAKALPNHTVLFDQNYKFAAGWNRAMRYLETTYHPDAVWMLNDDILYEDQWMLDRLWSAMMCNPIAAAITPVFNSPHDTFHMSKNNTYGLRKVKWVDWCVPLVSMKAWKEVGDFDESFVGYGADIDWCHRAQQLGWEFYVHESCTIHHIGSVSTEKLGANDMRDTQGMAEKIQRKWGLSWWELIH